MKTTGISCVTKFRLLVFLGHPTPQSILQSWSDKSQRFFFLDKIIDNSFAMFFWKKRIRNIVVTSKQIQSY